jgi:hypothetical protein
MFNSAKGRFDKSQPRPGTRPATTSPPRRQRLRRHPRAGNACPNTSAKHFSEVNDLDAVASATPSYGGAFSATWPIPPI